MSVYDLVCKECGHKFMLDLTEPIRSKQKRCPECRSKVVRQSFGSYLRNGSLASQGRQSCATYG